MTDALLVDRHQPTAAKWSLPPDWPFPVTANSLATPFQSRGWYAAWVETVAEAEGAEPLLVRVPEVGRLQAALALQVCRVDGARELRPLSWPWADYQDAVGNADDPLVAEALAHALHRLVAKTGCPLRLDDVVPGGLLSRAMALLRAVPRATSPVGSIDLTDNETLERLTSGREHAVKWRRLERMGRVEVVHLRHADELTRRLPLFIDMHRRQWAERNDVVAPFDGGVVDEAFLAFGRHMGHEGTAMLTELLLDGDPIAAYFGFVDRRRYYGYRTAFEASYRRLSPGHLMLHRMMRDFAAAGLEALDLMRGAYAYKRDYVGTFGHNQGYVLEAT